MEGWGMQPVSCGLCCGWVALALPGKLETGALALLGKPETTALAQLLSGEAVVKQEHLLYQVSLK